MKQYQYSLAYVIIMGILCMILGIWIATPEEKEVFVPNKPPYSELDSGRCGFCWSLYEGQLRMHYEFDGTVWKIRPELLECYKRLWKESVQLYNSDNPQTEM
jgi:hypothetical protein